MAPTASQGVKEKMPTSSINNSSSQDGFTLLELMVVIALAMIALTIFSLTLGSPSDDSRVRHAARQLASGLNYAQSLTARRGEAVDFIIDPTLRTFWIDKQTAPASLGEGISLSVRSAREVRSGDGTPVIRFLPDGSATGGLVVLTAGRASRNVEVDWLTGVVSIAN